MFKKKGLVTGKSKFDKYLAVIVSILCVFGLVMIYDVSLAQAIKDFGDSFYYIRQQSTWMLIGFFAALVLFRFDYRHLRKLALILIVLSIFLLLAVFIPGLGFSVGGAQRWLALGFINLQPVEIIKLTGVIFLAAIFEKGIRIIPMLILLLTVTFIIAVLQKDLGSAAVFVITTAFMYFIAGAPIMHFALAIPTILLGFISLILTSEYRRKRVLAFLDPFSDTQGFSYHIMQVLIALGSGGIFGLGLGESRQKFEYIPEVTTDSIFAIVGEELGFIGGSIIVLLFVLLIWRGLKIANNAQDEFGRILATGLTVWLGIQAVINLSAMVALLPLTGVPLPFISYGGSALVVNMMAVGILLNISRIKS